MNAWQPIETVPKDGTAILACISGYENRTDLGGHPRAVCWTTDCGHGRETLRNMYGHKEPLVTHWMPLPAMQKNDCSACDHCTSPAVCINGSEWSDGTISHYPEDAEKRSEPGDKP